MKRLSLGSVLLLTILGCNRTPADRTGPPGRPDDDPPHHQNVIWMTANGGHSDSTVNADCVGSITMYRLRAKRKQKIRWYIQNDPYNECPELDVAKVELRFEKAVMAEGVDPNEAYLDVLRPKRKQHKIEGRVHAPEEPATIPDPNKPNPEPEERVTYLVFYDGKKASPDPELDIDGTCDYCLPAGTVPRVAETLPPTPPLRQ